MRFVVAVLCLVAAASVVAAAEIAISTDPPLPVPNPIANSGIELGPGDNPANWSFVAAIPDDCRTARQDGGRSGRLSLSKTLSGR